MGANCLYKSETIDEGKAWSVKAERLGNRCGELFSSFLEWIVDDCRKRKVSRIYFLMREGEFFHQILDAMPLERSEGLDCRNLSVSRMSTFLPSLWCSDVEEWERFLNQYKDQTASAFAASLGTPFGKTISLLREAGLQEEVPLKDQLPVFYEAMASPAVREYLKEQSTRGKDLLCRYLASCGLEDTSGKVAIVDIGWRGTIQDNLCRVLPHKTVIGYYLGLIPMLNRQPKNAIKQGFINKMPFAAGLLKSHTQLEMVCSSWRGSVIRYEEKADGTVIPVLEDNRQDVFSWNNYARSFQEGVIAAIKERRSGRKTALLSLTLFPNKAMAKAFFSFRYSERFGLGRDMDLSDMQFTWKPFLSALQGRAGLTELRTYLNATMWPQGFLRIHGLSVLIPVYNLILSVETHKSPN